jgi:hypothetical protein
VTIFFGKDFLMRRLSRAALVCFVLLGSSAMSHAHTTTYIAVLLGALEVPKNGSPGTGFATVTLDLDLVTLDIDVSFSRLLGTVTAAHLHAATPASFSGTAIPAIPFTSFPTGVTSGAYTRTIDLTTGTSYDPSYLAANGTLVVDSLNALDLALDSGRAYVNIHTTAFPGGEIRGFLVPASAPEPTPMLLMGLGGLSSLIVARRHKKS